MSADNISRLEARYASHTARLLMSYYKAIHPDCDPRQVFDRVTPEELLAFPRWLGRAYAGSSVCRATLACWKTALCHCLDCVLPVETIKAIRAFRPGKVPSRGSHGPSLRARSVSPGQMRAFLQCVRATGSRNAETVVLFLQAGLASGLRPVEWLGATWTEVPGGGLLSVPNAKRHIILQRGNGETRHLLFTGEETRWRRERIQAFLRHLERIFETEPLPPGGRACLFARVRRRCSVLLSLVYRRQKELGAAEPLPRVTLYTTRHVFAADMKRAARERGLAPRHVAALLGHARDRSQKSYSGMEKAIGLPGFPQPLPDEVRRVRGTPGLPPSLAARLRAESGSAPARKGAARDSP